MTFISSHPDLEAQELEIKKQVIDSTNVSFSSLIPTNDIDVKTALRRLGHPICYFGETAMDRRQRLAKIILMIQEEKDSESLDWKGILGAREENEVDQDNEEIEDLFVTEGPNELIFWRKYLWDYSRERANQRLKNEYIERVSFLNKMKYPDEFSNVVLDGIRIRRQLIKHVKNIELYASQTPQKRPLSSISARASGLEFIENIKIESDETISSEQINQGLILTGSYDGDLNLWSLDSNSNYKLLKIYPPGEQLESNTSQHGHEERITSVSFNPIEQLNNNFVSFASGSADTTAKLWNLNSSQPIATLKGHTNRLGRISFHPTGRLLGTSSYDGTWRLWDLEKELCLLEQEGHSRGVYDIQFHPDGSLAASCDLGGIVRIWDLRSSQSLLHMGSHVRKILSISFSPNGTQLASASDDNSIKIWDLRMRKFIYRIPAHQKLVSRVRFDKSGRFILSSSFDRTIKIWLNGEYKLVKTLEGHSGPISDFDVLNKPSSNENLQIVSCGLDRTWKVYQ